LSREVWRRLSDEDDSCYFPITRLLIEMIIRFSHLEKCSLILQVFHLPLVLIFSILIILFSLWFVIVSLVTIMFKVPLIQTVRRRNNTKCRD